MPFQSEYQRKYRTRSKTETVEDYQVKAGYRTQRRAIEHRHTPLCWDVDSDEERDSSSSIPANVSLDAKKNKVKAPTRSKEADSGGENRTVEVVKPVIDVVPEASHSNIGLNEIEKVKRDDNCGNGAGSKSKGKRKRTKSRSVRHTRGGKTNPPLLPYGMAYKGEGTDKKRTFNVLAADDVFPSALRAAKRREIEINRKKERKKSEAEKKIADVMFNFVPKDTDTYLTEYQRNFCHVNPSQCKR